MSEYAFSKSGEDLVSEIAGLVDSYQEYCIRTGLSSEWRKNRCFYENRMFGTSYSSSDIMDAGSIGELKALTFNHFRNVLRHQYNIIININPTFNVTARTTSSNSRRSMKVGKAISDYYFTRYGLKKITAAVAEKAIVYGDGFLTAEFDPTIGREITQDEFGKKLTEGDFVFDHISPLHCFYDATRPDKASLPWITFRRRRNKYDIAAIFKNKKEKIIALDEFYNSDLSSGWINTDWVDYSDVETDDIYVYSTYHKKSNVLPDGKYILWAGSKDQPILLYDGPNPYGDKLPVFPMSPASRIESSIGFAEANVLRAPQMVLTTAISNIVSNMTAFGTNNLWVPTGGNLSIEEISDGMNFIQSHVEPKVISFYKENPDMFNIFNMGTSNLETLSGQNAVIRGNVQEAPNLKSGIAIATVINLAREYSAYLIESYYDTVENCLNFIIDTLQEMGTEERLIEITGNRNRSYVDTFKRDDVSEISSIKIERVNPIAKSSSGQVEIAMELLKTGQINPSQFYEVVNTGNIDSSTESDDKLWDYINSVKDLLLEGREIPAIPGVNHQLLISEVQSLLEDVELITDQSRANVVKNISKLIQDHMTLMRNGDEISELIYGGKPPMPAQIPAQEVAGGGLPPQGQEVNPMQAGPAAPMQDQPPPQGILG